MKRLNVQHHACSAAPSYFSLGMQADSKSPLPATHRALARMQTVSDDVCMQVIRRDEASGAATLLYRVLVDRGVSWPLACQQLAEGMAAARAPRTRQAGVCAPVPRALIYAPWP